MDISIVIVNWNARSLLRNCLRSIAETVQDISYEVIVVDNASTDGSKDMIRKEFPFVRLIENDRNRGFGTANNQAFQVMEGCYALLLNSDTVLTEGAVQELYSFMKTHADAAMVCGQLLNADGSKQNSIAAFPNLVTLLANMSLLEYLFPVRYPSKRYEHHQPIEVESGVGACLMVRREAMNDTGLFDERYFFFFEETDWAFRMRKAGWKVFHVPTARIYHFQGQSIGHDAASRMAFYRTRYQFLRKWHSHPYFLICCMAIFLRLAVNCLFTMAGNIITLGLIRNLRERWVLYLRLLIWHFRFDFS